MKSGPTRKLIEVALPLEAMNRASRADKNRKTGSIRNLHKWFAPMPSPAWRALLAATLLDDPEEPEARQKLLESLTALLPEDGTAPPEHAVRAIRNALHQQGLSSDSVLVFDPFAGGGSTLVEAQRLNLDTYGSDLNPVPALISRFLTQILPSLDRTEPLLAGSTQLMDDAVATFEADALYLINEVGAEARVTLNTAYPVLDDGVPFAWLWCHSILCPNPACRRDVPLHAGNVVSAHRSNPAWLAHVVTDEAIEFRVVTEQRLASPPTKLGSRRAEFACPVCNTGIDERYVKIHVNELHVRPMATAVLNGRSRSFVGSADHRATFMEHLELPDLDLVPLPRAGLGLRVQPYGFRTYQDLFLPRQQLALATFAELVDEKYGELTERFGEDPYVRSLVTFLGICVGKLAHVLSKQATWRTRNGPSKAEAAFGQSVLPMVWDFAEVNPFGGSVGDWHQVAETAMRALKVAARTQARGQVELADARTAARGLPAGRSVLVATDPPYFDAIGYADLSDYFYIWHRLALRRVWPDLYTTAAVPRGGELIADPGRHHGDWREATDYFIDGFTETFGALSASADPLLPMLVVYAHQQKERGYGSYGSTGWEAMLQAAVNARLQITASWPVHCTSETRLRGQDSNALASYVVLACRPRPEEAPATTRRALLVALAAQLPQALKDLQQGSVAPVDLAQAAIGPGMAVYSSYSRVIEADGTDMTVRTALALINQVLDEVLSEQEGDFDSDTRFCLKWFGQYGWDEGPSGTADTLSRATNTSVPGLERAGIFHARAGKARLLDFAELAADWNPTIDDRISVWEVVVHLATTLDKQGGEVAARLMSAAGQRVNLDAAKELAYLLFSISEKRGWTQSALLFNGLGTSWSDLSAAARSAARAAPATQGALDFDDDEEG